MSLLDALASADVERVFGEMEGEAQAWLDREAVPPPRRRVARAFDMRYLGQNFELTVAAPAGADREALRRAFLAEHERVYGYAAADEPIQIVNFRLAALGDPDPLDLPPLRRAASADADEARAGERSVWFDEPARFVPTPIYRRERLLAGHRLVGPAIVEQMDSTTVVLPGQAATIDERGNLLITVTVTVTGKGEESGG